MKKCFLTLALYSLLSAAALSQISWDPGTTISKFQSFSNSDQYYSIHIPKNYSDSIKHPILFIMDPRGNAIHPLEKFKEAADSLNYVLMSSYNTRSDSDPQVTITAFNAMLYDAFQIFSLDTTRFYLAGFSGTARISWSFGYEIDDYVSGIIGVGAGIGNGFSLLDNVLEKGKPFNYYGTSGFSDFNYYELLDLDPFLTKLEFPHHINFFEGGHQWPEAGILQDALYWMEIMAMKQNKIDTDSILVNSLFQNWKTTASTIQSKKDYYHLNLFLKSMNRTFGSFEFIDISFTDSLEKELRANISLESISDEATKNIQEYYDFSQLIQDTFQRYHAENKSISYQELDKILNFSSLIKQKKSETDRSKLRSINAFLELIFVHANFYQLNSYIADNNYENAKVMLQIANTIKKNQPQICSKFARVYSQLEEWNNAIDALKCIQDMTWYNEFILSDSLLAPLRNTTEFKDFIQN